MQIISGNLKFSAGLAIDDALGKFFIHNVVGYTRQKKEAPTDPRYLGSSSPTNYSCGPGALGPRHFLHCWLTGQMTGWMDGWTEVRGQPRMGRVD